MGLTARTSVEDLDNVKATDMIMLTLTLLKKYIRTQ